MKNLTVISKWFLILFILLYAIPSFAQTPVGCYDDKNNYIDCIKDAGKTWTAFKDGVEYIVWCDCNYNPPYRYKPKSSSSNSNSNSSNLNFNSDKEFVVSVVQVVITKIFDWLFSEPSPEEKWKQEQQDIKRAEEKRKKELAEYNEKLLKQISDAQNEFKKQANSYFNKQKEPIINEMKDRVAKSDAIKAAKQANCAAFYSLKAYELSRIGDFSDFTNPGGDAENMRTLADFPNANLTDCPPVKVSVPEVTANQPISFQETYFNYIKKQADSIKSTVDSLKVKKVDNEKVIEEKKQKVEEVTKVIETKKNQEEDQDYLDALKELENANKDLETAKDNDKKMKEEIDQNDKKIKTLDKMRSMYDEEKK